MSATTQEHQDRVVLACIDEAAVVPPVCDYAAWVAKGIGAPLRLMHPIPRRQDPAVSDLSGAIGLGSREGLLDELTALEQARSRLLIEHGRSILDAAEARVVAAGVPEPERSQRHGSLTESLVALEDEVRLVVVGVHGEAGAREKAGVGNRLEGVLRALHRPVLLVNTPFVQPTRVMLAYNGSTASRKALQMISSSRLFAGCACHVVYVGTNGQALLDEAAVPLTAAGLDVTTAQVSGGRIADRLAAYQAEHDIHVTLMGAFSHSRVRGFLMGSFTARMLAATQRPLLLLR